MKNQTKYLIKVIQFNPKKVLYSSYEWFETLEKAQKHGLQIKESLKETHVYNGKWILTVK